MNQSQCGHKHGPSHSQGSQPNKQAQHNHLSGCNLEGIMPHKKDTEHSPVHNKGLCACQDQDSASELLQCFSNYCHSTMSRSEDMGHERRGEWEGIGWERCGLNLLGCPTAYCLPQSKVGRAHSMMTDFQQTAFRLSNLIDLQTGEKLTTALHEVYKEKDV